MIYYNFEFIVLFLITVLLFSLFRQHTVRFFILTVASLIFYAWAGVFDTLIFVFVIICSWFSMWLSFRFPRLRTFFLVLGSVIMLLHLFFWKYAPWFSTQIQIVFPHFLGGKKLELPLPVGISFFTLQGVAYLVDLKRNKASYMPFRQFLLFKSFFSQLVAGPIVRSHQLLPQIKNLKGPNSEAIATGISLFVMGLAKKMIIADWIAPHVDQIFSSPHVYGRVSIALGIVLYSIQIWADFSGYTDMGRGTAKILGIHLPENFLSPYLSQSPSEFWKRWHITLSQWIRDYIYIPLGGSQGTFLRITLVTFAAMGISGLWHGANWTFAIWGLYHAALLVGERLIKKSPLPNLFRKLPSLVTTMTCLFSTFIVTQLGWLIFRSTDLDGLISSLRVLFLAPGALSYSFPKIAYGVCLLGFLLQIIFYRDLKTESYFVLEKTRKWLEAGKYWNRYVQNQNLKTCLGSLCGIGLACCFIVIILARAKNLNPFIYFQF